MTSEQNTAAPTVYDSWITPSALAAKLGVNVEQICKLDANESPFGPPPAALHALASLAQNGEGVLGAGRYPDATGQALRNALSIYTRVPAEQIVVGNGSDELIHLLIDLLLVPDDEVVVFEPTFSLYALASSRRGGVVVDAGTSDDFTVSPRRINRAITKKTRLVFLCSPNNPTGAPLRRETLFAALERAEELGPIEKGGPLIILDEAYYEIGALANSPEAWTAAPMVADNPRLIVLRTFSKLFGLAGLRVGYALCSPAIATQLRQMKMPYNVNVAGLVAAQAALTEAVWLREKATTLVAERERMFRALRTFSHLQAVPSSANFLLVRIVDVADPAAAAHSLWQGLLDRGIMTRLFSDARLAGCLRIAIGTREQNDRLLASLDNFFGGTR